ncbi:MAG: LytTR family DNA-binding domain-containing protein [Bacilli bacterium]
MIKTAIIEDEDQAAQTLQKYLEKFFTENGIQYEIVRFYEGLSFLSDYHSFDLAFMDIEMPHMNGIEVAKKLREKDNKISLIFVTNMVQYAIKGYEVDAIDYVLKPIQATRFEALMNKTMRLIKNEQEQEVRLKTTGGITKVFLSSIIYIEVEDHLLIYHTSEGEIQVWGTLSSAEKSLPKDSFFRCNNSTIINTQKIVSLDHDSVYLKGWKNPLSVSRSKRKDLLDIVGSSKEK